LRPRTDRQGLGALGEAVAAIWLEDLGFRLLAQNHRCRWGEVDIVAEDGDCLCFVEVRTRRGSFVTPAETIGLRKQRRVVTAAYDFLVRGEVAHQRAMRFDVVEVLVDRSENLSLTLHRDAFAAGEC
jgi:putative endonuclease